MQGRSLPKWIKKKDCIAREVHLENLTTLRERQTLYHITVMSNFARGFDKYSNSYSKSGIPESTYPTRFFLLRADELSIGVEKATRLKNKLGLENNRLIAFETEVEGSDLHPNTTNGRGQFINSERIRLKRLHEVRYQQGFEITLSEITAEDAMSDSLRLLNPSLISFNEIGPRAISFLPIARACQAKCPFCFSKASVSSEQPPAKPDWELVRAWLRLARGRGAERAVITGGGEPTLLPEPDLLQLISLSKTEFEKVVLITNGHALACSTEPRQMERLQALYEAGLRVLAISRHHQNSESNRQLMSLDIPTETLIKTWRNRHEHWPSLRLRLICVLQKGGVEDLRTLKDYLSWATDMGVEEVCFKELYVSTSAESIYHDRAANEWSRLHQVSLSLVTDFVEQNGFMLESRLPWGAPVFAGYWREKPLRIAAYTEPSLFWERTHGVARSWNVMADGRCHVSLEDRSSEIKLEDLR